MLDEAVDRKDQLACFSQQHCNALTWRERETHNTNTHSACDRARVFDPCFKLTLKLLDYMHL